MTCTTPPAGVSSTVENLSLQEIVYRLDQHLFKTQNAYYQSLENGVFNTHYASKNAIINLNNLLVDTFRVLHLVKEQLEDEDPISIKEEDIETLSIEEWGFH